MTRESWQRAYAVLDEILDLDTEARRARLAQLELNAEEREYVEALLQADESDDGVLDRIPDAALSESPANGQEIGPWRLGPEIGRGGMSVVHRATRDDAGFEQTAALKLLHAARLDAASISRFQREQQILADLHHPNLATLLDGGVTDTGTPYLVMEEVRGERLDGYCSERDLDARAIVRLMLPICDAVAFAHRSLVVHRDLKPANILVGEDDRPRLLDFGVAKLLAAEESDLTTTRVLTPGFGAPEQASGGAVTTATDVYGLGAVLYRLLTHSTPYPAEAMLDLPNAPPPIAPSRTSDKVGGIDSDLDNVVLMALRAEPERRYASAEALARDLHSWLDGHPVVATPDRVGYRLRKLVSRHRTAFAAAVIAVLALLAGSGVALWQTSVARAESGRAQVAADEAARQAQRAEAVTEFLVSTFAAADPEASLGADVTVRQVLDAGIERLDHELADEMETQAQLRSVLGEISYLLGEFDMAESLLSENLALEGRDRESRLRDLSLAAHNASTQGNHDLAEQRYADTIELARQIDPQERAVAELSYATYLIESSRAKVALDRLDDVSAQVWLPSAPEEQVAILEATLAAALLQMGQVDEAARRAERALQLRGKQTDRALALGILSNIRAEQGDLESAIDLKHQALELQQQLLGPDHPHTQISRNDLATMLKNVGRFAESAELLQSVLAQQTVLLGDEHPHVATAHFNLGQALFLAGSQDSALDHYRQAMTLTDRAPAAAGPFQGVYRVIYGHALALTTASITAGEQYLVEGIRLVAASAGADHPLTARVRTLYAEVLNDSGRNDEARAQTEPSLPILEGSYGAESRHTALARIEWGRAIAEASPEQAEAALRDAVAAFQHSSYRLQYQRQIAKAEAMLRGMSSTTH
ncbi:MAG: serine/threonine-protein kinase [Thermoanaerobaculia bacterium]|nr:serine/threonine-protein kinase [Thermoanaerobaculia bacterium]